MQAWRNWETFNERKDAYKEFYDKQVKFCKERDEEFLKWQEDVEDREE